MMLSMMLNNAEHDAEHDAEYDAAGSSDDLQHVKRLSELLFQVMVVSLNLPTMAVSGIHFMLQLSNARLLLRQLCSETIGLIKRFWHRILHTWLIVMVLVVLLPSQSLLVSGVCLGAVVRAGVIYDWVQSKRCIIWRLLCGRVLTVG